MRDQDALPCVDAGPDTVHWGGQPRDNRDFVHWCFVKRSDVKPQKSGPAAPELNLAIPRR
jgi:hypothetical protein